MIEFIQLGINEYHFLYKGKYEGVFRPGFYWDEIDWHRCPPDWEDAEEEISKEWRKDENQFMDSVN